MSSMVLIFPVRRFLSVQNKPLFLCEYVSGSVCPVFFQWYTVGRAFFTFFNVEGFPMSSLPSLKIKDFELRTCIVQGGMGVGVSRHPLARAVAREGGLGLLSSAGLSSIASAEEGRKVDTYTAVRRELELAMQDGGPVGINIMCALVQDFEPSVRAAFDAGAAAIVCGAGLPTNLPTIQNPGKTALIPIVSSARALDLICRKWEKVPYRPDAVVLEGPLAGGHLGFKLEDIEKPEHQLENLLPGVLEVAHKYGDFPVIEAGGRYTHEDIEESLSRDASGVQMGTRFLATHESSATAEYKKAVVEATEEDMIVAGYPVCTPASPCGLPFRVLKCSPAFHNPRKPRCDKGYVLQRDQKGNFSVCPAKGDNPEHEKYFCICNALLSSAGFNEGEHPLYTAGANVHRVKEIMSVADLMKELRGH